MSRIAFRSLVSVIVSFALDRKPIRGSVNMPINHVAMGMTRNVMYVIFSFHVFLFFLLPLGILLFQKSVKAGGGAGVLQGVAGGGVSIGNEGKGAVRYGAITECYSNASFLIVVHAPPPFRRVQPPGLGEH
jgi:hypothetical protein